MELLEKAVAEKKIVKLVGTNQYLNVYKKDGQFSVCPVGGGFVKTFTGDDDSIFEIVDQMPSEHKKGVFHLDGEPNLIFEGYAIPSNRWNGWAIPVFEIEVAKKIAEVVNGTMSEFYAVERHDDEGLFKMEEKDWECTQDLKDFVINVDGKDLVVVDFMGANWTWEGCYGEEAVEMLARAVPFTPEAE